MSMKQPFHGFWKGIHVPAGVEVFEASSEEFAVRFPGGDVERCRLRHGMADPREPVVFDWFITGRGWRRGFKVPSQQIAREVTRALADAAKHRKQVGRAGRVRANPAKPPTKAEMDALIHTYSRLKHFRREYSRYAGHAGVEQKLYANYTRALDKVLAKIGGTTLSAENQRGVDAAADTWWAHKGMRGPGVDW